MDAEDQADGSDEQRTASVEARPIASSETNHREDVASANAVLENVSEMPLAIAPRNEDVPSDVNVPSAGAEEELPAAVVNEIFDLVESGDMQMHEEPSMPRAEEEGDVAMQDGERAVEGEGEQQPHENGEQMIEENNENRVREAGAEGDVEGGGERGLMLGPLFLEYVPESPSPPQADEDLPMEDESEDASDDASDLVFEDLVPDNTTASRRRRWYLYADHMHSAIRELVALGRRSEASSQLQRDDLLQRMRRALFSLEHNIQQDRGDNAENVENEVEAEVEDSGPVENPVGFDTNLPAEHSYLGNNMDRVSGVNYLDVGQQYRMLMFMHQHVLFPGEILPLMISESVIESDLNGENGLLFGICFPSLRNEQDENFYGVTCQIYEKGTDSRGNTLIKSRALQRFITKVSEFTGPLQFITSHPQLKCYGIVKILPEIYLREPLKCINMGSMNRFRDNDSMRETYKRFQAATTPWPAHIYEYYSISGIVEKARSRLEQHKIDTMPTDPTQLSFWLVRNLHLSENMLKSIFTTDSVNTRLKLISNTFKESSIFTCRYCGNRIANCSELFAMSKHGVQTQYCNSAGYIHETNTVYQVLPDAVSYSGEPSAEFSWFPGYQWHIIVCKICLRHIGWKFKALTPNLVPKSFFGLSSSSVRISAAMYAPTNPRSVILQSFMRGARREFQ